MPGWTKPVEVNFVPLQAAVFCAECERISESHTPYCAACGSRALLNLSRVLGGSLRGQNTARLIADAELDRLVREVISTVPQPVASEHKVARSPVSGRHHLRNANGLQGALDLVHPLLSKRDLDLGELDLEPTISLIAERAQTITAATGAAVALRHGSEIVCRARAGRTAPDLGVRLQTDSGLSAECVRTGEVLLCGDAEANARVDLASCRRLGVRSILVAPLRYFRRTLGLFEVLSSAPYAFDHQDVASLQMLAGLTVAAISRRASHVPGRPAGPALQ
ncbi:MAG TPA: GAF domain-containing protein [Terriglobales bacterium]|nr:GAF domain-containing protein [Terriglobales bacterium]